MPGARVVPFGHLGDGNIHFNVSQPVGADKAAFLAQWEAMNEVVHGVVAQFSGSISAEHGIGQLKRGLLRANQGSRRARCDARAEGDARSPRNFESGQGAVEFGEVANRVRLAMSGIDASQSFPSAIADAWRASIVAAD